MKRNCAKMYMWKHWYTAQNWGEDWLWWEKTWHGIQSLCMILSGEEISQTHMVAVEMTEDDAYDT